MKKLHRRHFIQSTLAAAGLSAVSRVACAQAYPARPVRTIVGSPAGGPQDIVARLFSQWLSERLGQQFIVENRPGAATNLGAEAVVRAPPDGYTMLLCASPNAINATLYDNLGFNFLRDIAPVASTVRVPLVMNVNLSLPAKTVPEFIAYAKANPGKINMASGGSGSGPHVSGELFKVMTGIDMLHVPYRGDAPALTDVIGGHAHVMFGALPGSIEHIRAARLRALAVTTAARSEVLPDIPALSQFVPGYEASIWYGIGAPKNTPAEIISILNAAINAALADPKIQARLADLGGIPLAGSPADFGRLIAGETEKWAKVVKLAGIKPE
jgi:tripartite-type tricarboxylate transporter receptor subunit TctC